MADLNFPTNPELDETYIANNVIYTWNGEYWEANTTNGFDSRYVEVAGDNMTGNLTLGTDKITLKADGSGSFASNVTIDGNVLVDDNGKRRAVINGTQGSASFAIDDAGDAKITLNQDGSASYAGDVTLGTNSSTVGGISLYSGGAADIFRANTTSNNTLLAMYSLFNGGTRSKVAEFTVDGSLSIGGTVPSSPNIYLVQNGSSYLAGTMGIGGTAASPNIELNADGSGTFDNKITIGDDGVVPFVSIQKSVITNGTNALIAEPVTNEGALQVGHAWGSANQPCAEFGYGSYTTGSITATSVINRDGSHYIGGTLPDAPNITLNADGLINNQRIAASTTPIARFKGMVDSSTERGRIEFFGDGSAQFTGNITADNVTFNLEADDDTKYTTTTDVDGNETRVYNGATLDMKEVGLALVALKSAAAAASDFTTLKSAIATALANL